MKPKILRKQDTSSGTVHCGVTVILVPRYKCLDLLTFLHNLATDQQQCAIRQCFARPTHSTLMQLLSNTRLGLPMVPLHPQSCALQDNGNRVELHLLQTSDTHH